MAEQGCGAGRRSGAAEQGGKPSLNRTNLWSTGENRGSLRYGRPERRERGAVMAAAAGAAWPCVRAVPDGAQNLLIAGQACMAGLERSVAAGREETVGEADGAGGVPDC